MKICIVGCGAQGGGIAGLLAREKDVEQLVLADIDEKRLKLTLERIETLGSKVKLETQKVDGTKREDVARLAKGTDIVFNATHPVANVPIMEACLDVGAHYLDLMSSFKVLDAQLALDNKFKDAGLTALLDVGVQPGWADIAARYIIDQLDAVDSVIIRWAEWYDSHGLVIVFDPSAVLALNMPQPRCWDNGEIKNVNLFESREDYEWPEFLGVTSVYTEAHLDVVIRTIPQFINKPIKHIELKSGFRIGCWNTEDIWVEALRRQISKPLGGEVTNLYQLLGSSFTFCEDAKEARDKGIILDGAFGVSAEVSGKRNGQRVRHTMYDIVTLSEALEWLPWSNPMVHATAGGLSIEAVLMIGRGEITKKGVIGGGSLDNYKTILKRVAGRGHRLSEKIERAALF
jgi:saccharopine dehydrogenase-like NADP-dependent oxidoreductase